MNIDNIDQPGKKKMSSLVQTSSNTQIPRKCEGKITIGEQYLKTLNEKEFKAYEIAKRCLGTSFDLEKSNGFLTWLEEMDNLENRRTLG